MAERIHNTQKKDAIDNGQLTMDNEGISCANDLKSMAEGHTSIVNCQFSIVNSDN